MSPAIKNQAKLAAIALAMGLAWTAFGTGTALAASESERTCVADGGEWDKATKTCSESHTNTAGGSDTSWTVESEQTAHGNLKNKHTPPPETTCSGPGGSQPAPKCN